MENDGSYNIFVKQPIGPSGDLQGRKIRSSATYHSVLKLLGASPVGMPAGEVYSALEKGVDFAAVKVDEVMTRSPRTLSPGALAVEAVSLMETHKINQLLVVDERGALLGALNMHDLFRAKVI